MIFLLGGVKISAVRCLVLSQSARVTDRQNHDSQDRASIAASRGKNINFVHRENGFLDRITRAYAVSVIAKSLVNCGCLGYRHNFHWRFIVNCLMSCNRCVLQRITTDERCNNAYSNTCCMMSRLPPIITVTVTCMIQLSVIYRRVMKAARSVCLELNLWSICCDADRVTVY